MTFLHSPSSLLHLRNVGGGPPPPPPPASPTADPDVPPSEGDEAEGGSWSAAKTKSIVGPLSFVALGFLLGDALASRFLGAYSGESDAWLPLLLSSVFGAVGYKLFGGDKARIRELPKDGGYDAKFVVDRPQRLECILDRIRRDDDDGRGWKVEESKRDGDDRRSTALRYAGEVHGEEYLEELRVAVEDARTTSRIRRLHPTVMRTLIDGSSYDAALDGVADWIEAVDAALLGRKGPTEGGGGERRPSDGPIFALTRPPTHHASVDRGTGGCLLNGPAAAAFYALDSGGASNVAILDFDAHHGNGIADCVQNEERIRYCSIHEEVADKRWFGGANDAKDLRGPGESDAGPLGTIRNVPLKRGTGWDDGYSKALTEVALPFLSENDPDVLLVTAGFDALECDRTSGLALRIGDYEAMGSMVRDRFGDRVAFGLEGGYAWEGGELGEAVARFVAPWGS